MTETFDVNAFQRGIIQEFRTNGGKVGGMFRDSTLALLTTTGARTGEQRTVPLGYLEVDGKPVVVLHRLDPAPGTAPVKGMGDFLVEVHDWLRNQLADLRRQVDEALASGAPLLPAAGLGEQMREHCRAFCGALTQHHTGEDMAAFPELARQLPALRPALQKLGAEHEVVADLQRLLGGNTGDPRMLRDELDRLSAALDAHFRYEEETVVAALNATAEAPKFE